MTSFANSEGEVLETGEEEEEEGEEKAAPANSIQSLRAWREDWAIEMSWSLMKKIKLERM